MNIYLIGQRENKDPDAYYSAVVVAATEEEARDIHPDGSGKIDWEKMEKKMFVYWARRREDVHVTQIGVSDSEEARVVVASFNAG